MTIKSVTLFLLWLTIYTHHLPRLTFYFDWRWDSKWHFCHKLQLRKWLHNVKLFFVLVTNVLLKCEKLKENMSWCEAWRKLRTSSFSFLLWHDGFGYNYGVCLSVMFECMTYQRKCLDLHLHNLLSNKMTGKLSCSMYIIHYKNEMENKN